MSVVTKCVQLGRQLLRALRYPPCLFLMFMTLSLLVVMPLLSSNIPMSKLYSKYHNDDISLQMAQELNDQRFRKAYQYFESLDKQRSREFHNLAKDSKPDLVISIITTHRRFSSGFTHYLIQTAAVVDQMVKADNSFSNVMLFICNVDNSPGDHRDAVILQDYIPYVQMKGPNSFNFTFGTFDFRAKNLDTARGQELKDYLFCLNVSQHWKSDYVFMLEDDVIPYKNALNVIHYILKKHSFLHSSHGKPNIAGREFSFLKLYFPERWQGFANEADRVVELISYGLVGGALVLALISVTCVCQLELTYKTKLFIYTVGCVLTIYSVALLDRQQVMEFRRLSPQLFRLAPTPACCTPAMLYSSHVIPRLITHLIDVSHMNKDLAIFNFIQHEHIPGYLLEPNLVRHIGMYTSLQNQHKPPSEFLFNIE